MDRLRDLSEFTLDPEAIARLGRGFCKRKHVVILGSIPEDEAAPIDVGMAEPEDQALVAVLRAHLGRAIRPHQLSLEAIAQALQTGAPPTIEMPELRWGDADPSRTETPTGRAVLDLLQRALLARATSLQISATHATVRARIDGSLAPFPSAIDAHNAHAFVAHLLDQASLPSNLDDPARGQFEGQFVPPGEETARTVVFGLSAMPGEHAPHLTITLHDGQLPELALDVLGMSAAQQQACRSAVARPGVVLLGGPAGSGRTTTLYALLEATASAQRAGALVESQPARALSSACERLALPPDADRAWRRHLWTSDWDRVALDPADGHPVLGELWAHEPSGRSTLGVVRSFGVGPLLRQLAARDLDPEAVAQSLRALVHQRLLRRLCRACAAPGGSSPQTEAIGAAWGRPLPSLHPAGCEHCGGSGYIGRVGIFEVSDWPARQARPQTTHAALWAAGLARVEAEDTTLAELWDVLGPPPQSLPHASQAP